MCTFSRKLPDDGQQVGPKQFGTLINKWKCFL